MEKKVKSFCLKTTSCPSVWKGFPRFRSCVPLHWSVLEQGIEPLQVSASQPTRAMFLLLVSFYHKTTVFPEALEKWKHFYFWTRSFFKKNSSGSSSSSSFYSPAFIFVEETVQVSWNASSALFCLLTLHLNHFAESYFTALNSFSEVRSFLSFWILLVTNALSMKTKIFLNGAEYDECVIIPSMFPLQSCL